MVNRLRWIALLEEGVFVHQSFDAIDDLTRIRFRRGSLYGDTLSLCNELRRDVESDNEHRYGREKPAKYLRRLYPGHSRHEEIQYYDVRLTLLSFVDRVGSVQCFSTNNPLGMLFE